VKKIIENRLGGPKEVFALHAVSQVPGRDVMNKVQVKSVLGTMPLISINLGIGAESTPDKLPNFFNASRA